MSVSNKFESPYSAAITGGGLMFEETDLLLPLLMSPDKEVLLKEEILHNNILHINAETARSRNVHEIKKRFETMPIEFWQAYQTMDESDRKAALFYVILKTYKIIFDFHINVGMRKWNSVTKQVERQDLMIEFDEIGMKDAFVESWSDNTKRKIASAYLTILRKIGMADNKGVLSQLNISNPEFYISGLGEPWFLEATFMAPYQIETLKKQLV